MGIKEMKSMTERSICLTKEKVQLLWEWEKEPELKLSLEIRMSDDVAVVHCKGRIVYRKEVAALSCAVEELMPQARQIILDLSEVETMDGAGLGALMALLSGAKQKGCTITLAAPSHEIRALLELTRLDSAFEIHPTLNDALLAVHAQAV